jgi:flagellar biosynthesis protein FlhG
MTSAAAKVISISSGKGGVGKTHTTVNLGLALVKMGKRVLLLDADLGLANINVILGFEPKSNIADLLAGRVTMDELIVSHPTGLDIIPASSGITELTNLSDAEQITLVDELENLAREYDFLLVDTAAGIGDNVLYFNEAAEEIILIVDKEPTSITDAYAVMKVLSAKGVKEFSILANRIPHGSDGKSVYAQLSAVAQKFLPVKMKYLGMVQEDVAVREAVIAQRPYLELYPTSKASLDISKIAKKIAETSSTRTARGGMQFFFRSIVES